MGKGVWGEGLNNNARQNCHIENPVFSVYVVEVLPGGRGWGRRRGCGEGVVGEGVAGGLDWGAGGAGLGGWWVALCPKNRPKHALVPSV